MSEAKNPVNYDKRQAGEVISSEKKTLAEGATEINRATVNREKRSDLLEVAEANSESVLQILRWPWYVRPSELSRIWHEVA